MSVMRFAVHPDQGSRAEPFASLHVGDRFHHQPSHSQRLSWRFSKALIEVQQDAYQLWKGFGCFRVKL